MSGLVRSVWLVKSVWLDLLKMQDWANYTIVIMCLTTSSAQVLDVSVNKPFKSAMRIACHGHFANIVQEAVARGQDTVA